VPRRSLGTSRPSTARAGAVERLLHRHVRIMR
jgi:hypothetical protein